MTLLTSVVVLVLAGVAEIAGWRSYAVGLLVLVPAMLAVGLYTASEYSE